MGRQKDLKRTVRGVFFLGRATETPTSGLDNGIGGRDERERELEACGGKSP